MSANLMDMLKVWKCTFDWFAGRVNDDDDDDDDDDSDDVRRRGRKYTSLVEFLFQSK